MSGRTSGWTRSVRRAAVAALVVGAAGAVAACGPAGDDPSASPTSTLAVEVAGELGERPSVTIPPGFTVTETSTATLIAGDGPVVTEGQTILLDYFAIDIATGETIADTFATLPEIRTFTADDLGGALYDMIDGATLGSRIERIELGTKKDPHPHVLVVDLPRLRAVGEEIAATVDPGLPTVERGEDGAPVVTIPETSAPHQTQTTTLIKGTGPQVGVGQSVILQLSAVRWSDGAVVDSTWETRPRALAVSDLPRGLAGGLVEQTAGSQVLVVVPPEDGNGVDTLVYVVDILATADVALPPAGTEHEPVEEDPATGEPAVDGSAQG
ncbi:peptidylprolyl isomerase [Salana multivorans]|uniref:Peptidylprolyl isomerase n=1 Tax=Salana multivorans TaxID=120377 RepID=A0A3N2D108_9MICO|nr:hypothetical protein [Salana multivorans]OJX94235.1 MAG: hypothetical protein BGO96_14980 [Micrococcales bacterium 73-15]ROR93423.1 peptidylprolyl isomerase [Salana multivorans]